MIRPAGPAARTPVETADHALEADVMRFVAILALCLVAISTLVDGLPPPGPVPVPAPVSVPVSAPEPAEQERPPPEPEPARPDPSKMVPAPPASPPASASARAGGAVPITPTGPVRDPDPTPARPRVNERHAAAGIPAAEQQPDAPSAPEPTLPAATARQAHRETAPVTAPRAPAPPAAAAGSPAAPRQGFTLRFASDAALLRLVAAGAAEVFVFAGEETLRLRLAETGPAFAAAAGPGEFHAIDGDTVPAMLSEALAQGGLEPAGVVWGVTLPTETRAALARLIRAHDGGELVIDRRGRVRLEADDG